MDRLISSHLGWAANRFTCPDEHQSLDSSIEQQELVPVTGLQHRKTRGNMLLSLILT